MPKIVLHGVLLFLIALTMAIPAQAADMAESGLPIPRFVSLRYEEVNLRTGPGTRYPISWVYKRKGLPMEVVEEFGHWRKLRDIHNDEGWVHKSQLSGSRTAIFKDDTTLYRYPEKDAPPMLKVQKNVIGELMECDVNWCRIQVESYKAWTLKSHIWGIYEREVL